MSNLLINPYLLIAAGLLLFIQMAMFLYYLVRKSQENVCPKCGNIHSGVRIGRTTLVKVFLSPYISDIRYYKCLSCYSNFFIVTKDEKDSKNESNSIKNVTTIDK